MKKVLCVFVMYIVICMNILASSGGNVLISECITNGNKVDISIVSYGCVGNVYLYVDDNYVGKTFSFSPSFIFEGKGRHLIQVKAQEENDYYDSVVEVNIR